MLYFIWVHATSAGLGQPFPWRHLGKICWCLILEVAMLTQFCNAQVKIVIWQVWQARGGGPWESLGHCKNISGVKQMAFLNVCVKINQHINSGIVRYLFMRVDIMRVLNVIQIWFLLINLKLKNCTFNHHFDSTISERADFCLY